MSRNDEIHRPSRVSVSRSTSTHFDGKAEFGHFDPQLSNLKSVQRKKKRHPNSNFSTNAPRYRLHHRRDFNKTIIHNFNMVQLQRVAILVIKWARPRQHGHTQTRPYTSSRDSQFQSIPIHKFQFKFNTYTYTIQYLVDKYDQKPLPISIHQETRGQKVGKYRYQKNGREVTIKKPSVRKR